MFYHLDYHKLPAGTPVESFSRELAERHRAEIERGAAILERIPERPGGPPKDVRSLADRTLEPGASVRIAIEGEGTLGSIRVRLAEPTGKVLRGVVLEVAFEDPARASVRVPVGDFFGSGCGDRRFASLPAGMTAEGYYSWWPMPHRKAAFVTLRNETPSPVRVDQLEVGDVPGPVPANAGYFHARYVEDPDIAKDKDYRILEVSGRGKLVGTNVTMQNARGAQGIFFLEGDEKIYVDGETYPSRWLGTGAEDYFNGAYFWNAPDKQAMARPYGGLTFLDWGIGRVCAYRWHVLDWIPFARDIRVDLEHGGESEWPSHYQSVAYYYLEEPSPQPALPPLAARLPKTPLPPAPATLCCDLDGTPSIGGRPLSKRGFGELDAEYSSEDSLLHGLLGPGREVRVPILVPGKDDFGIALFLSGGPDFARLSASLDGVALGDVDPRRPEFVPWFASEFAPRRLDGGKHELVLERVTTEVGAATAPERPLAAVGLVAVQLRPRSRLLDRWSIVGNWPCPRDAGWDEKPGPEISRALDAVYTLPGGGEARWREYTGDFVGLGGGDWHVAYGLTWVHSPDDREVGCFIGKDDGLRIWVNGAVVFDRNTWSHPVPDSFHCALRLRKGWNEVLVKCANWSGGWGFCLRIGDPEKELRYARKPD